MFWRHLHNANDAKIFLKHFSDCLFYFCSTYADSNMWPLIGDECLANKKIKKEDYQNCSVLYCVPQLYQVICILIWAVLTGELGPLCLALSPVSTTRVDGPSWRVTGFHYPSTRAVLTGARFPLLELTHRQLRPLTRAVNSRSGNRALGLGFVHVFVFLLTVASFFRLRVSMCVFWCIFSCWWVWLSLPVQSIAWKLGKTRLLRNDQCVEWDVKFCS